MIKFTADYVAGMFAGAGIVLFFLGLAAQSELVPADLLTKSGCTVVGMILLVTGSGMKFRSQSAGQPERKG